ncbi:MAG: hypothetical protein ABJA02_02610 [Acidobacteriota bacterium]
MLKNFSATALACVTIALFAVAPTFAQDESTAIDSSKIPASANSLDAFVPAGWKIEEKIEGDLNDDKKSDTILKLIEDKPDTAKDGMKTDRSRALVIVFAGGDAKYRLAAVNGTLLQCTSCGGAFYGFVDAPANVSIAKGVIVIEQDHGSRDVTDTTYRFRFDQQPNMFILIGFDYSTRDRAAGGVWTESTNYLTGKRITTVDKGKKATTRTTTIAKDRIALEAVDGDKMDAEATHRLGLD